LENDRFSTF